MHKDEELAQERYWARRKKFTSVETGIYAGEEWIEFKETRIFQTVGVILPVTFQDMDVAEARRKYPSEQRPKIIKTNLDGSVNFTFNLVNQKLEETQLEAVVTDFARVMKRLYPTNICLKLEEGCGAGLPYAAMEFTSVAINENLYNMLAAYKLKDQLLLFLFNCLYESRTEWENCLVQIRERVTDHSEDKEGTYAAN